jgi:hypothetical protein
MMKIQEVISEAGLRLTPVFEAGRQNAGGPKELRFFLASMASHNPHD